MNTFFDPKIDGFPPILESLVDYYRTSILVSCIDPAERALAFAALNARAPQHVIDKIIRRQPELDEEELMRRWAEATGSSVQDLVDWIDGSRSSSPGVHFRVSRACRHWLGLTSYPRRFGRARREDV